MPESGAGPMIAVLGSRWALQILVALIDGRKRFSDLRRALGGISAKVLTLRLRELEALSLVRREDLSPPAAGQAYGLTPVAESLRPALRHLAAWRPGPT
jgi:DNA-binding HxlR family transcriptional regulator